MPQTLAQLVRAKYPGVYDQLDDEQLEAAVVKKFPGVYDAVPKTTKKAAAPEESLVGGLLTGAGKRLYDTAINLGEMAHKVPGIGAAVDYVYGAPQAESYERERQSAGVAPTTGAQRAGGVITDIAASIVPGAKVSSLAKGAAAMAPRFTGPLVRGAVEGLGAAGIAGAQGQNPLAAGVMGGTLGAVTGGIGAKLINPNPAERAAVAFGQSQGIPISAGTATGNLAVRGAEFLADRSIAGSVVSGKAKQAQAEALKRVGGELAERVRPRAVTPYQAGASVTKAVEAKIAQHSQEANTAYDALRQIENSPQLTKNVRVKVPMTDSAGTVTMQSVTVPMQMPVDLRGVKSMLKPIYERMLRQMPITQQQSSKPLNAIKNILDSTDYMPASVIDMDLSALKSMARNTDLQPVSQALASTAIGTLDDAVKAAVAQGGPAAERALLTGRTATKAKYLADDILEKLRDEPAQVFNQATANKDSAVDQLRELSRLAPAEMKNIGRAYLDDLLTKASAEGGFLKTGTIAESWKNLGPQTKQLIFRDPNLVRDLDHFFLLARKMGENLNPSGTGFIVGLGAQGAQVMMDPLSAIGTQVGLGGLSKLLHSRMGVKLLTEGIRLPVGSAPFTQMVANLAAHVGNE